jgi:hypothetical protein
MLVVLCKNLYTVSYLTLKLASLYVCFSIRLFILHGRFDCQEANTMLNDIRDGCAYGEVVMLSELVMMRLMRDFELP